MELALPWTSSRKVGALPAIFVTVLALTLLWDTWAVWPLKLICVFFHEISHGLAAVATGGSIGRIMLESNESGRTMAIGGSRFLVLNAGYVGSCLWGCGLILASAKTDKDRLLTAILGLFMGFITLWYVRSPFGFIFGGLVAAGLFWCSQKLSDEQNDLILKTIGGACCLYVIPDIWSDVVRSSCNSDAKMLAREYFGPKLVWGLAWIGASIAALAATLKNSR
ncbi:MAG: M50 family metallopeptidase [Elusimicrobia bacterium]|nr:M50 family metallopeptidase [Elusimicrobiota bacterium]